MQGCALYNFGKRTANPFGHTIFLAGVQLTNPEKNRQPILAQRCFSCYSPKTSNKHLNKLNQTSSDQYGRQTASPLWHNNFGIAELPSCYQGDIVKTFFLYGFRLLSGFLPQMVLIVWNGHLNRNGNALFNN